MKHFIRALWAVCLGTAMAAAGLADDIQTVNQRLIANLLLLPHHDFTVQSWLSSLQPSGSWSDIKYADNSQSYWSPELHLERLQTMAEAYEDPSSTLYQSTALKTGMILAYDYWIAANLQGPGWWYQDIDVPNSMGNIMILINGVLSAYEQAAGQKIISQAYAPRSQNSGTNTGENRVWRAAACIDLGVLTDSATLTSASFGAIGDTLVITTSEGIQPDYSFHQHGPQLYGGGYGMRFGSDTASDCLLGAGTSFALSSSMEQTLVNYLVDGQQWFCRGTAYDYTAMGRLVTQPQTSTTAALNLIPAVQDMLQTTTYGQSQLQSMLTCFQTAASTGQATPSLALSGNRCFWCSDIMVQQRPAYYTSVKISSVRTSQPEVGTDGAGRENLYLAAGVTLIEVTGNEYNNIFPVWDWRRLPGTTIEQNNIPLTPPLPLGMQGTATYAGGVSNGTYGAEAFSYSQGNVSALKSWFFFDNEWVALGAGINAPNASAPVITTLNQCLLTSPVTYATASGGTQTLSSGTATMGNLSWVYQGGVGYLFPTPPSSATVMATAQSGSWSSINTSQSPATVTANVFSLQINHPATPTNDTYAYVVVPGTTTSGMAAYAANVPVTVLRNDPTVQAVTNSGLGLTEAAFYSPGALSISPADNYWINPNAPALILLTRTATGLSISASNPLAAALALQIQVGFPLAKYWNGGSGYSTVTLNLAGGSLGGSTVTQFFAYPLTWQAGSGTWSSNSGQSFWTTSLSGTASLPWTDSTDANFSASGLSSITVQGVVNVNNMTISGTGYSFSGGTLNLTGGIQSTVDTTVATFLSPAAPQTWLASTPGKTLTISGCVANNGNLLTLDGAGNEFIAGVISGSGGLTKTGNGMLTVSDSNTYTGGTLVTAGTLQIGYGGTTGSVAGNIENYAALVFNRSDNPTFSGVISGSGSLTKIGRGALTLGGANVYTGVTTVSAGTLAVGPDGSINASSGVSIGPGAVLEVTAGTSDNHLPSTSNLTLNGGMLYYAANGSLNAGESAGTLTLAPGHSQVVATNAGSGTPYLRFASASPHTVGATVGFSASDSQIGFLSNPPTVVNGILPYAFYSSMNSTNVDFATLSTSAGVTLVSALTYSGSTAGDIGPMRSAGSPNYGALNVVASGSQTPLGQPHGFNSLKLLGSLSIAMTGGGNLTLNSGGLICAGGSSMIDGGAVWAPTGELIINTASDLTISSVISTSAALVKTGTSTLTLTATYPIDGDTFINQGTLVYAPTGNVKYKHSISGAGSLQMSGNAILTLSGSNTYTGGTVVSAGTLDVTNPAALPDGASLTIGANATSVFGGAVATGNATSTPEGVPEPSTFALLGVGAIGIAIRGWCRRKRSAQQ